VTTGGEHEKVQGIDGHEVDARDVSERFDAALVVLVDDQRTPAALVRAAAHLSLARSRLLALAFRQFFAESEVFEALNCVFCLGDFFNIIRDDEWDFLGGFCDSVSARFNERSARSGR